MHRVAQLVHLTEVLLPGIIQGVEHDRLVKLLDDALALCAVCLSEVARDIVHLITIRDRYDDALELVALRLVEVVQDRVSDRGDLLALVVECLIDRLKGLVDHLIRVARLEGFRSQLSLYGQHREEFVAEALVVVRLLILIDNRLGHVVEHVEDVHADALAHQGVATLLVDTLTL